MDTTEAGNQLFFNISGHMPVYVQENKKNELRNNSDSDTCLLKIKQCVYIALYLVIHPFSVKSICHIYAVSCTPFHVVSGYHSSYISCYK